MITMDNNPKKLSKRKQDFVQAYIFGPSAFNAKASAIVAGYTDGAGIRVTASRLLNEPNVQLELQRQLKIITDKTEVTPEGVVEELWKIANGVKNSESARVSALTALGKYFSLFTDVIDHKGINPIAELSDDRLQELLGQALATGKVVPIRKVSGE